MIPKGKIPKYTEASFRLAEMAKQVQEMAVILDDEEFGPDRVSLEGLSYKINQMSSSLNLKAKDAFLSQEAPSQTFEEYNEQVES